MARRVARSAATGGACVALVVVGALLLAGWWR
jgi:hypothetical protein